MGFELVRFVDGGDGVDEELLCPICSGVLQDPVHTPQCEHAFCRMCIKKWLDRAAVCPIDRFAITPQQLKPVPRILRTLLARLQLSCVFQEYGCAAIVKLDRLESHEAECEHNPCKPVPCREGCGLIVPKNQLPEHNCIQELHAVVRKQQTKINDLELELKNHWTEICRLKDFVNARPESSQAPLSDGVLQERQDQLLRWSSTLQQARVTRWGGMISTPDSNLQSMVKRALLECGCPSTAIQDLIENAHERRWPMGLHTLETRQRNRRAYDSFVCRRIPGKQAVVVLSCDNPHIGPDMIVQPGLVMIFAHGIE